MTASLLIASLMVTLTVIIHFAGLLVLMRVLERRGHHLRAHESTWGQGVLLILVVLGIVAIHTVEIWVYAILYYEIGAVADFESALYFSTVAFSSLGYGDIVLTHQWRLLSAIEAVNGLMLIGWSTAFLISLMGKLRALEHEWLDRSKREN